MDVTSFELRNEVDKGEYVLFKVRRIKIEWMLFERNPEIHQTLFLIWRIL